jgi:aspartyl-tRNA(Asn)/glutamyl-tRNA(Gln) amidotransferase subunit A
VDDLSFRSITELSRLIGAGSVSPVEVVTDLLERLDRYEPVMKSHITVCGDLALSAARQAEREIGSGSHRGPLHGIPVSHKDICWTEGVATTAHSRTMLDFVPDEDATYVRRLRDAGMILLGKTNTTEFACGDMDEFGYTPNPWGLQRFSGASSGGSASALAAGLAIATTGTDTGGSIRAPAGLCGIVGVKPTYGRVSRHGVYPLSWTMDHVGPMTRTVADAALMLNAMSGHDEKDRTSSRAPVPDFTAGLTDDLHGLTLGVPEHHFYERLEPQVERAVTTALRQLEQLGARLEQVPLPSAGDLEAVGSILVMAEAFAQHAARLRAAADRYGPRARRRISAGAFYTSAEYQQALQLRAEWIRELESALADVSAIVTPTLPFTAFTLEDQLSGPPDTSWGTRHFNLSGNPALTLPCGFGDEGLPIGLQIVARAFDEAMMFRVAHAYEQATEWHLRRPELPEAVT